MKKKTIFLLLFFLQFQPLLAEDPKQPFWKSKTEVYRRIKEERAVIVSAKTEKNKEGGRRITLATAGWIRAPLNFTHKNLTDYSQYAKILPYVDDSSYDSEAGTLFARGSFMGFTTHATIEMKSSKVSEGEVAKINFKIISGFLTGLTGVIIEEKVKRNTTEVSMEAQYSGKAAIPNILLSYGFEFMGHKMASAMRSYVETQWEKEEDL